MTRASTQPVFQTLAWCRKQEFQAVPLHPQSKAAISRRYVDSNYQSPPDSLWQGTNYGVGIVTGPSVKGPVDIDLDCPEALVFAPLFLPKTPAVFGRASKLNSHYLYRVEASELDKLTFLDPLEKSTVVEIRADGGHQTVMPGSLHQDTGELIQWSDLPFPDVPRVEADVLIKAVRKVALAVLLIRHVWQDGQRNEMTKHLAGLFFYLHWTVDEVIDLVNALDDYCESHDKTHKLTIVSTYKKAERGGKITGATTLRKLLDPVLVDRILEWSGSSLVDFLPEYNERWAVVSLEGRYRIVDTDVEPGKQPVFYHKDDFLGFMSTDYAVIDGKQLSKARKWLSNSQRRTYRSVDFLPGIEDSELVLNLWTGWAVPPRPGNCEAWLTLLERVICGGDQALYRWMLHWFANVIREPRDRSMTAPVIIGRQGAGKSLLLSYFGKVLGSAYTVITNDEHLYGRFNKHLGTTLLLHSEEALYGGELKHRGIIKSLITDEHRIFEQKGVDAYQVRNYIRLVLTSNNVHAAPAEANDRRFTVIDLDRRMIDEELKQAVLLELYNGGPAALHQFFLDYDYDPSVPRTNFKNDALSALKDIGLKDEASWWREVLMSGFILPDYLSWAQRPAGENPWPATVSSTVLIQVMQSRLREMRSRNIPNESGFAKSLNNFTGMTLKRAQRSFDNPMSDEVPQWVKLLPRQQQAIVNLPDLTTCRAAFCAYVGHAIDWPDEDTEPKPKERY